MSEPVVDVHLVGFPLRIWLAAQEHHEELRREFALLMLASAAPSDVPRRVVDLVETLSRRFASTVAPVAAVREAAVRRGDETVDLTFRLPRDGREAALALAEVLDEADDYCRRERLLTLETPVPALAFRRWYLAEFVRQIDGLPPRPWPGVEAALAIDVAATPA